MPAGYKIRGVPALLFDRLSHAPPRSEDQGGRERQAAGAYHTYDEAALRESVEQQLAWLLNTRAPVSYDILDDRNRDGVRSTIDYGLPDLSSYPLREYAAMTRLCAHLEQTIAFFEPRLHAPAVTIKAFEGRGEGIIVEVRGALRIDEVMTPATFEMSVGSAKVEPSGW